MTKPKIELVPAEALLAITLAMMAGEEKHGNAWEKGRSWMEEFASAQRHLWAWRSGETIDAETNLPHIYLALSRLAILAAYENRKLGTDDRQPGTPAVEPSPEDMAPARELSGAELASAIRAYREKHPEISALWQEKPEDMTEPGEWAWVGEVDPHDSPVMQAHQRAMNQAAAPRHPNDPNVAPGASARNEWSGQQLWRAFRALHGREPMHGDPYPEDWSAEERLRFNAYMRSTGAWTHQI